MSWGRVQVLAVLVGGVAFAGVGMLRVEPLLAKGRGTQSGAATASSQGVSPITDGPTLFRERGCAQCHAIRGVGGHKGPDLSGVGRRMNKAGLYKQIEEGSAEMPAFGGVIAEDEIGSLVKYLGHCKDKTKGKGAAAVPAPTVEPAQ